MFFTYSDFFLYAVKVENEFSDLFLKSVQIWYEVSVLHMGDTS